MKYSRKSNKKTFKKKSVKKSITKKINQIMTVQKATRPEKIRKEVSSFAVRIGQLNGATGDGAVVFDVTPRPAQSDQTGGTTGGRHGAGINLMSSHYNFQIGQQDDTAFAIKYRITWVAIKGAPYTNATIVTQFFNNMFSPNPFVGSSLTPIRDADCNRNPDYFGTYRILKTITKVLKEDQLTGVLNTMSFQTGFKYNRGKGHAVRYNQNLMGTDDVFDGQIIMIVQCDRGNSNQSVASTITNTYTTAVNTGIFFSYNRIDYYYDN